LDNSGSIVAHWLDSLDEIQQVLLQSFGWTLGLTIMLALAVEFSWAMARFAALTH